jgi:hypothetical protein
MIKLVLTSRAYPEQYDAYDGETQVAYLRLRRGHFTVECPDCDGEIVYEASPRGDRMFEDDERDRFLRAAMDAIQEWLARRR